MLPAPDAFRARNQAGFQLGSTGVFQFIYRLRALGPLHLEAGAMGADHVANFSAGVLLGASLVRRWLPYLGFGGGVMWAFGPKAADGCDPNTTQCPTVTDSDSLAFLYARVGLGVAVGAQRNYLVSIDVGGWRGSHVAHRSDPTGVDVATTTRVLTPMAGLSCVYAF